MKPEFNIDRIVNYLQKHKEKLEKLYLWNPEIQSLEKLNILLNEEINVLKELHKKPFDKRLALQEFIFSKLNSFIENQNQVKYYELSLWIIKDWGGINNAKDEATQDLIDKIYQGTEPTFNRISSTSKILAFLKPENYVIYDSRVAYALNWIILKKDAGNKFFPIPEGRNSKMSAFDLEVLIRLKNIKSYQPTIESDLAKKLFISELDKNIFIPKDMAYPQLNKLIKSVNERLWAGNTEKMKNLYFTEMILFSIADKAIFEDITKTLTLNFNV